MKKIKLVSQVLFLMILGAPFSSFAGSEGGGGGTSVVYKEQRLLIDLLSIPSLVEGGLGYKSSKSPLTEAKHTLNNWSNDIFAIGSLQAASALRSGIQWSMVDESIPLSKRYYSNTGINFYEPKTIAYYQEKGRKFFVKISKSGFEELSFVSQVALYVHEALRHVQIGWSNTNDNLSERALQEATAIFVLCKPSSELNMYVNYLMQYGYKYTESIYGNSKEFVENSCEEKL